MRLDEELKQPFCDTAFQDLSWLAVRWEPAVVAAQKKSLLSSLGLSRIEKLPDSVPSDVTYGASLNDSPELWWVRRGDGQPVDDEALTALEADANTSWVSSAYRGSQGLDDDAKLFAVDPSRLYVAEELPFARVPFQLGELGGQVEVMERESERFYNLIVWKLKEVSLAEGRTSVGFVRELADVLQPASMKVSYDIVPLLGGAQSDLASCAETTQWNLCAVEAPAGWMEAQMTGCPDVGVAVVDNGVDLLHEHLKLGGFSHNVTTGGDGGPAPPSHPHGTKVAGIISAQWEATNKIVGLSSECPIISIAFSYISSQDVAAAIKLAAEHSRVINLSISDPLGTSWEYGSVRDHIEIAYEEHDIVFAAASGNDNLPSCYYPGRDPHTLCVGGSDEKGQRWHSGQYEGANYGDALDVIAPAARVPTTDLMPQAFTNFTGTSAATPHVSALAALMLSVCPGMRNDDVYEIIRSTCRKLAGYHASVDPGDWNEEVGYGLINVKDAIERTLAGCVRSRAVC